MNVNNESLESVRLCDTQNISTDEYRLFSLQWHGTAMGVHGTAMAWGYSGSTCHGGTVMALLRTNERM